MCFIDSGLWCWDATTQAASDDALSQRRGWRGVLSFSFEVGMRQGRVTLPCKSLRGVRAPNKKLIKEYTDNLVTEAILGVSQFDARIGFECVRSSITIHPNWSSAFEYADVATAEIKDEVKRNRLRTYCSYNTLPGYYIASPLGLTHKSHGTKRRIHHLSYSPNDANSINSGIPQLHGSISYSSITEPISAIQHLNSCSLLSVTLKAPFATFLFLLMIRPYSVFTGETRTKQNNTCLSGFAAHYIINLLAETFHWILEDELQRMALPAKIVHYLDDFLIILPLTTTPDLNIYTTRFSELCQEVGLSIKESKKEEGTIASFGGIEMDTENMVIRLPEKKLLKAQLLVQNAIDQTSLSLLELKRLTGYLNFVARVVPLGSNFLRRLYNMQLYVPTERSYYHRRISSEAQRDLTWWQKVLAMTPERSIRKESRGPISLWSDAAGTKGLRAFYIESYPQQNPQPNP